MMVDDLTPTAVLPQLTTHWLGHAYHYFPVITSTNDRLKEMAGEAEPPPTGTLLLADYQSAGRGRLNRQWEAEAGTSLMFSLLLRPDWPPPKTMWLTMLACLAATTAAESWLTTTPVGVKWPNDLMLLQEGRWHKWGGLLLEGSVAENGRLQHVILGMGLNINMSAAQLPHGLNPVSSLSLAAGQPISRLALLCDILQRLEEAYEAADNGRSPQPAWRDRLITLGQAVTVTQPGQPPVQGTAVDIAEWGQLVVETEQGRQQVIAAGDVSLR